MIKKGEFDKKLSIYKKIRNFYKFEFIENL